MGDQIQPRTKAALKAMCTRTVRKVSGVSPVGKRAIADALTEQLCKNPDQKLLKMLAEEVAFNAKAKNLKAPKWPTTVNLKVKSAPKFKQWGKDMPSVTIPLHPIIPGLSRYGKLTLKVWKDRSSPEKGGLLNFTVEI